MLFFDHTVSILAEIRNETTCTYCTYQNERHFQSMDQTLKTQRADLSSLISKCAQLKLHRTLAQRRMSFSSLFLMTQSIKTAWCDRVTRRAFERLKPYPQIEKHLKIATKEARSFSAH